jgi:exodeoxyribonuclease V alpha subunit
VNQDISQSEEKLRAYVHRVVFTNPETGFTVLSVKSSPKNRRVIVLGELASLNPGQPVCFYGHYERNPKHGRQFRASRWEEIRPETHDGLVRYLSGQFKGIGPKLAERIVATLGLNTLDIIDATPDKLSSVPGIGKDKTDAIKQEWKNKRALAETSLFLSFLKLGPLTSAKIIRKYGFAAEQIIRENPYCLSSDITGIGFVSADDVAARLEITGEDTRRIRAGICYELEKARDDGHTCLPRKELVAECVTLLNIPGKKVNLSLENARQEGLLVFRKRVDGQTMIFEKNMDWVEQNLADNLNRLKRKQTKQVYVDVSAIYADELRRTGMSADEMQHTAMDLVRKNSVLVITGGPGTGKTTLVRLLIKMFKNMRIRLAAPTGRAAQRLYEASGMEAATIHRMLEFTPQNGGFNRNAKRPLPADVVIVDESSMLDTPLAMALTRAVKPGIHLIFVGDVDQLPSVGPGKVLEDLIESETIPVVKLKHIYRQEGGSDIVANAHRIIRGELPVIEKSNKTSDFVFIEKDDPEAVLGVIKRLPHRIAQHLNVDPLEDVQILSPMHRGLLGVRHLNETLRDILNPNGKTIQGAGDFRVGDKVMQTKNNYDQDVFNGDIGQIVSCDTSGRILIRFGHRMIPYLPESMDQITPAYASSIHKSQGSEYPAVVIPLHTQHFVMLRRQLLYTAVTRGKKLVVIVGSKKALALAVKNNKENARYTLLKYRIRKY